MDAVTRMIQAAIRNERIVVFSLRVEATLFPWNQLIGLLLLGLWAAGSLLPLNVAWSQTTAIAPQQDDATLHDLQVAGTSFVWVVGDHGAIWASADAGGTWEQQPSGVTGTLRSACFLSDRLGWVAGGDPLPHTTLGRGILLVTRDGGQTWSSAPTHELPPLQVIRFFDPQEGLAIAAQPDATGQTVFRTQDGGKSWLPLSATQATNWRGAHLLYPDMGLLGGKGGRVALLAGDQLLPSRLPEMGRRSVRSVHVQGTDRAWLAGEGSYLLTSGSGGVVWEEPTAPVSNALRYLVDFRTVDARDQKVWLAGQPGSVIWRSEDAGKTWARSPTGQSLPIERLRMLDDLHGFAVGGMGLVLRTGDGGQTWDIMRGGERRLGWLALSPRPERIDWAMAVRMAGEDGYRGKIWSATPGISSRQASEADEELRLHAGAMTVGVNEAEQAWLWALQKPGLEFELNRLIQDWQSRTEGRLSDVFLQQLVVQLRMYRPSVVVLDQPSPDDAVSKLLFDATLHAIKQAADATRFPELATDLQLASWQVERIYQKLPTGSQGELHFDLYEALPRRGGTVKQQAGQAAATVGMNGLGEGNRSDYRLLDLSGQTVLGTVGSRGFFLGLKATDEAAYRRALPAIDDTAVEAATALAQRQRNFAAVVERQGNDPRVAAQMVAQIPVLLQGASDTEGAASLLEMARRYREREQFELAAQTYFDLARRFPAESASIEAVQWLVTYWASAEMIWQRDRSQSRNMAIVQGQTRKILQALQEVREGTREPNLPASPDEKPLVQAAGVAEGSVVSLQTQEDRQRARELMVQLLRNFPQVAKSPDLQLPLATLERASGRHQNADGIYRQLQRTPDLNPWRSVFQQETWLLQPFGESPRGFTTARRAVTPPVLDGLLSDECWQGAKVAPLTSLQTTGMTGDAEGYAQWAYDGRFLYFAATIPREPSQPVAPLELSGRTHDTPDVERFDHLTLRFDVDRDYRTFYEFQIDQRGKTAERVWEHPGWNPKWFVAMDADDRRWAVEAAIPLSEMSPENPSRGHIWACSLIRTIPGVGWQSTVPLESVASPQGAFGLLRFE